MSYLDDAEKFVRRRLIEDGSRDSFVYIVEAVGLDQVKIGTAGDIMKRLTALQCASPVPLKALDQISGGHFTEKWLHFRFRLHLVRGEWYRADCGWLKAFEHIQKLRADLD